MKDNLLEMSQLQTLLAVTRAGSFSKAAENLRVTQSAISQSVKNLENKVDVKIFNRNGKKISLTQEGEKLFDLAKEVVLRIEDTLDEIHVDKNEMSGNIRIGTLNGVGKTWLGSQMLDFSQDYPDVSVSVVMDKHDVMVKQFERNLLDFLLLPEYAIPNVGEKVLITEEQSTFVFHEKFKDLLSGDLQFDVLNKIPLVLFEENDPLFLQWCRMCFGMVPKKIRPKFTINSHGYILKAVAEGLGAAVVPTHVLKRSSQRDRILTLGEQYVVKNYKFYLVYHKESLDIFRFKKLIDVLTKKLDPFDDRS